MPNDSTNEGCALLLLRANGYILLEIPGGPDELAKAVNFLRQTPDVTVQVQVDYAAKVGQA